jgi:hypothetical protein
MRTRAQRKQVGDLVTLERVGDVEPCLETAIVPVELVLLTHGAPTDRANLACALSPSAPTRPAGPDD